MKLLLLLQAKHTQEGNTSWGVNGETGTLADMTQLGIWEPLAVKAQTYKTAVEVYTLKASLFFSILQCVQNYQEKMIYPKLSILCRYLPLTCNVNYTCIDYFIIK